MSKAVRFDRYGDVDVLQVVEVEKPVPGPGQVVVQVKAAAINPGEVHIRNGALHDRWPATFPSGQGSDLAGIVDQVGAGVEGYAVGDEVIGFTDNRASHAEYVLVEAADLTPKPQDVSWEEAGTLYVAGTTAYAMARAAGVGEGDTVVVAGAAGGVGSIAVQLLVAKGATVIGLAGAGNHQWLRDHGVIPVTYGEGVADRIRAAAGDRKIDAFLDIVGGDYVEIALGLGVTPQRINTVVNYQAVEKHGVISEGNAAAGNATVLAELAELISAGRLEIPIAAVYPLDQVRDAFREVEKHHTRGKIVLRP